jgi:hypothetical protein
MSSPSFLFLVRKGQEEGRIGRGRIRTGDREGKDREGKDREGKDREGKDREGGIGIGRINVLSFSPQPTGAFEVPECKWMWLCV